MNLGTQQQPPARVKSQPQRVVDSVSQRIRAGLLKPGDRVPSEPELVKEFGVSRTVVREAMSRLQASGMVETRQGVGTFVLAPPAAEPLLSIDSRGIQLRQILAMLELRISLEAEAASLAAQRRGDGHLLAMQTALDSFEARRLAGESTVEDDFRFHAQIAAATGNEYFEQVLASLGSATIQRRPAGPPVPVPAMAPGTDDAVPPRFGTPMPSLETGKDITHGEHVLIYEAIRRGDPAAARAAMFIHLNNSRERLRAKAGGG